ncbi:MAG TPA: DUF2946 domain-containing protein [Stellaceae bacterium]|jgi:hypothetical protein
MIARRHRLPPTRPPRGVWLAFFAVTLQVLLPFFLALQIAHAEEPGSAAVICSALGHDTHQGSSPADQGQIDQCCSICTTLEAAQGFAPPMTLPLAMPAEIGRNVLAASNVAWRALLIASPYQSRGPPSIA